MKKIFFIHIAKTGGVSVEENLTKNIAAVPCPAYEWDELLKVENIDDYNLFFGHLQYFCKDFIGDAFSFTVLRNPIERAVSAWEHILREPNHSAQEFMPEGMDIKSALEIKQLQRHLSNAMTWFLGARPQYDSYPTKEQAIRHAIHGLADKKMLDSAKECIDQLDFIGFTETLNQDTLTLFEILGYDGVAERDLVIKNYNPQKESINYRDGLDAETRTLLMEANALDYELYEYAYAVAQARYKSLADK